MPIGDKNDKCEVLVPGMAQNRFPTSVMLLERCGNGCHWTPEEDLGQYPGKMHGSLAKIKHEDGNCNRNPYRPYGQMERAC